MTNPPPPELFPQRPVRSDFGARPYRKRRLITMVVLIAVIGLGLYLKYGRKPEAPGPIPTIAAAGPLKQKPQEPGGVAIPNQNVLAYQQIDNSGKDKPAVAAAGNAQARDAGRGARAASRHAILAAGQDRNLAAAAVAQAGDHRCAAQSSCGHG